MEISIGIVLELKDIEGSLKYLVNPKYIESLINAKPKGINLNIKKITYEDNIEQLHVDGIILIGGGIYSKSVKNKPSLYEANPKRYKFEKKLIEHFYKIKLPILGICRGFQMLNEVFGGKTDYITNSKFNHSSKSMHKIKIMEDSILHKIYNKSELIVNSAHHKNIIKISDKFKASAISEDGIIEAIESKFKPLFFGVQWHPEALADSKPLFKYFIDYCKNKKSI